jgi:hypothetical protein
LSNYISAKSKQQAGQERLQQLRTIALDNLRKLAKENVELASDEEENKNDFANMSITEKKKTIKKEISANLNLKLKEYIKQLDVLELENAFRNFVDWLK